MQRGLRTRTTSDALFAAACAEADAQEFVSIPELHDGRMRDAKSIIEEAAREQRRGRATK